jgi:hypothetical protein
MSRLALTFEMAEIIAARIADYSRKDSELAAAGALLLYADVGGIIGIRPDGTLVEWSHDGAGRDVRPVEDRIWALIALVAGAKRYPELRPLLTVRRPGAVDCACRTTPQCVSGLFYCDQCGGMGWLAARDPRPVVRPDRPRRASPLIGLVLVALAFISFFGALVVLTAPSREFIGNGLILIALGILSLVLASRGIGRRRSGSRRIAQGPTFTADDPEVAALPPTSMTRISEQIRQARERQNRAQD